MAFLGATPPRPVLTYIPVGMLYYAPVVARKSKEDAEKTRKRILASALSLFVKKGYEHTTFNDVAARLKMTKGAVYWHFKSKEELLVELVKMAFERFQRQIEERMPTGDLTFPTVAKMMVETAAQVVKDPQGTAFFKLMKCQIKWTDDSMASVRENLMSNVNCGPKHVIMAALRNDMACGRAHEVNVEEISAVAISIWDGLVQAKIDGFLICDLEETLTHAYAAIWGNVRK